MAVPFAAPPSRRPQGTLAKAQGGTYQRPTGVVLVESGLGRLKAEHPTIGGIEIFGNTIWLDWLMIVVMVLTRRPLRSYPAPAGRGALRQRPGG